MAKGRRFGLPVLSKGRRGEGEGEEAEGWRTVVHVDVVILCLPKVCKEIVSLPVRALSGAVCCPVPSGSALASSSRAWDPTSLPLTLFGCWRLSDMDLCHLARVCHETWRAPPPRMDLQLEEFYSEQSAAVPCKAETETESSWRMRHRLLAVVGRGGDEGLRRTSRPGTAPSLPLKVDVPRFLPNKPAGSKHLRTGGSDPEHHRRGWWAPARAPNRNQARGTGGLACHYERRDCQRGAGATAGPGRSLAQKGGARLSEIREPSEEMGQGSPGK